MTRQELWRATESYGELWELKRAMVLYSNYIFALPLKRYEELRRATESHEELRRVICRKLYITFKHEQTRATESHGELWRATESNGS